MKVNLSELKRFDKQISKVEDKFKPKINARYEKFAKEAKKQVKGLQSGYRKKINLESRTVKTNLRKELENNLKSYFNDLEKKSIDSVRKELAKTTTNKTDRLIISNLQANKSIAKNNKWAKQLADKQVKAFEDMVNKALKDAKKANPDITDKQLKSIIDDRLKAFKNTRLDNTIANEANRIQNQVRLEGYKDSGLVQGIIFVAVLDNRTTKNCETKNGTKLRIDDPRLQNYITPQHPRCRSYLSYILTKDKVRYTNNSKIDRQIKKYPVKEVKGQPKYYDYKIA